MIAIVIPTIRPEKLEVFKSKWEGLIRKHNVKLIVVWDGDNPTVENKSVQEVMGNYSNLIFNHQDSVRNLGFAYVVKYLPEVEYIITMDDDVEPIDDAIGRHVKVLQTRTHLSWISTASDYMRGFPYGIREEAEVVISHGVWDGDKDWDAPTQLVKGNPPVQFFVGPIPRGIYFPMCIMNVAFKRKALPIMYQVPMKDGMGRFSDMFSGIHIKNECDRLNWAIATGFVKVYHRKASNVFKNLQAEAKGIERNETYYKDGKCEEIEKWKEFCRECNIHLS